MSPDDPPPATAPFDPGLPDAGPLPALIVGAAIDGAKARFTVRLEGDTGPVTAWSVDYGDGERQERPGLPPRRLDHVYAAPEEKRDPARHYTATVVVFDLRGQQESGRVNITIQPPGNRAPTGDLQVEGSTGPVPLLTLFHLAGSDPDGKVTRWNFDPGDGTPPSAGETFPGHALRYEYRQIGRHNATLTVHDDDGATTTVHRTIHATAPNDTVVWSYDTETRRVALHDGHGVILVQHNTSAARCGDGCARPIAIATTNDAAYVLFDDARSPGHVAVFDPLSGELRRHVTVDAQPRIMTTDPSGTVWVAHQGGTLARLGPGEVRATLVRLPLGDGPKQLIPSADGRALFVAEAGTTGQVLRLDTTTLRVDLLPLILPGLSLAAYDDKHRALVAADESGRIVLATTTLYGPIPLTLHQADARAAVALACPPGGDTCTAAYPGPEGGRLVTFVAKPETTATAAATLRNTTLAPGLQPHALHLAPHATLVAVAARNATGFVVVDADGTQRGTMPYNGTAPASLTPHARQPRLVYHLAPDGRWGVFDLETGHVDHVATEALAGADGLALAYRPRTLS